MQQQLRLTEHERADLVAFLDGELDEDDSQKLEAKVAASVSAQKEIGALEKTWGMLDWLPRLEAPPDFASETVTRIHSQQLRVERIEGGVKRIASLAVKVLGCAAGLAAAAVIGFVAVRFAWPDPTRALIDDLEIVQNLESLQAVPDVKFLDDLSRLGVFADAPEPAADGPSGDSPPGPTRGSASPGRTPM